MDKINVPMAKGGRRKLGLSIWLWLMLIGGVIGVFSNLGSVITGVDTGYAGWALTILGFLGIANLVFIYWLFKWQMKGFYGICVTTGIGIIVNLVQASGIWVVLFGVLGPVILYLFMKPQWKMFK